MQLLFDQEIKDVRCVLPGTIIPLGKNGKYIERYFKDTFDIHVEYLEEAKTLPGKGEKSNRIDQIISVKEESVEKFAEIKDKIGAEYAEDIVRSGDHRLYKERIYLRWFQRIENELRKSGEIPEENMYQSKLR